jgi:hypothetical protein
LESFFQEKLVFYQGRISFNRDNFVFYHHEKSILREMFVFYSDRIMSRAGLFASAHKGFDPWLQARDCNAVPAHPILADGHQRLAPATAPFLERAVHGASLLPLRTRRNDSRPAHHRVLKRRERRGPERSSADRELLLERFPDHGIGNERQDKAQDEMHGGTLFGPVIVAPEPVEEGGDGLLALRKIVGA